MSPRLPNEGGEPLWRRYRDLVRRHDDQDVADEIRFHLEMREDEARRAGLADDAARLAALERFGDVAHVASELREIHRARERRRRRAEWAGEFVRDARLALRALRRAPAFTVAAVLTLALAIGATTAIFSVVYALLLRPLPYPRPRELVTVWGSRRGELVAFRARLRTVVGLAAWQPRGATLDDGSESARVDGAAATPELFTTLGVRAALGRTFTAEEGMRGGDDVVLLGHALWRRRFAGDPHVVGRRILVDGAPRTVVGVMPPEFAFPSERAEFWIPAIAEPGDAVGAWAIGGYTLIGRLRPGTPLAAAAREIHDVAPTLRRLNLIWDPGPEYGADATVTSLHESVVATTRPALLLLLGAVGLVLAVACVNVANLLLARATARQRELAVRAALGGGRGRLVRQLLAESLVLAGGGAALGLLVARLGLRWMIGALPPGVPRAGEIGLSAPVLLFTTGLAVLTGVAFGLLPALRASRAGGEIARAGRSGRGVGHQRVAAALVVGEVAVAVVLVASAVLLVRSFVELRRVDPGWRAARVVGARLTPPRHAFEDPARVAALYDAVLARVAALPGVESVGAVSELPLARPVYGMALRVEGQYEDLTRSLPQASHAQYVTPGYLATLGIPVLQGRDVADADRAGAPPVALVSASLARRFWPGESAVGKRIGYPYKSPWLTIVGVVRDVNVDSLRDTARVAVYVPFRQSRNSELTVVARSTGDPAAVGPALRAIVAEIDRSVSVSEVRTMDEVVGQSLAKPRFVTLLVGVFAGVALLLGAVGVYGVMSYLVAQRTRELGVRLALGATERDIVVTVSRWAVGLAAAGAVVGTGVALLLVPAFRSLLYGVSPADPVTVLGVPSFFVAVALLASAGPAVRAARVDPVTTLRGD
jgi:predicted permease